MGGRLRILHESNDNLSIETEIVRLDSEFVVAKAAISPGTSALLFPIIQESS